MDGEREVPYLTRVKAELLQAVEALGAELLTLEHPAEEIPELLKSWHNHALWSAIVEPRLKESYRNGQKAGGTTAGKPKTAFSGWKPKK